MYIAPNAVAGARLSDSSVHSKALDVAQALFAPYLTISDRERLVVAGFDSRLQLRTFGEATGDRTKVSGLVQLSRAALGDPNVSIMVIGHNHPSGVAVPSVADREATRRVAALCRLAGAQFAGHLLFAGAACTYFGTP
jgi:DNA repair protein RadC